MWGGLGGLTRRPALDQSLSDVAVIKDSSVLLVPDDSSSDSECESDGEGSSCSSSSDSEVFDVIAEIKRKKAHPDRLHEELWYNDPGQVGLL